MLGTFLHFLFILIKGRYSHLPVKRKWCSNHSDISFFFLSDVSDAKTAWFKPIYHGLIFYCFLFLENSAKDLRHKNKRHKLKIWVRPAVIGGGIFDFIRCSTHYVTDQFSVYVTISP